MASSRLEHSPLLSWLIVAIGGTYLIRYFMQSPEPLNAIDFNTINLAFLMLGLLLHKTPARLMRAVQEATPAVWGVILQFPFYAGIAGIITATHLSEKSRTSSSASRRRRRIRRSSPCIQRCSGCSCRRRLEMGDRGAVRDGGRAHAQGAPRLGGRSLRSRRGARQPDPAVLDAAGLGLFKLGARDIMGYTIVVFLALTPVVLILVTLLGMTLSYPCRERTTAHETHESHLFSRLSRFSWLSVSV